MIGLLWPQPTFRRTNDIVSLLGIEVGSGDTHMSVNRRNEARKLLATWLNGLGTGIISVGAFTPTAALLLGIQSRASTETIMLVIGTSVIAGIGFHVIGRLVLSGYEG